MDMCTHTQRARVDIRAAIFCTFKVHMHAWIHACMDTCMHAQGNFRAHLGQNARRLFLDERQLDERVIDMHAPHELGHKIELLHAHANVHGLSHRHRAADLWRAARNVVMRCLHCRLTVSACRAAIQPVRSYTHKALASGNTVKYCATEAARLDAVHSVG